MCLPFVSSAYSPDNCWSYVVERIGEIVLAAELVPNSDPKPGTIAVMRYEKQGLSHYAYVEVVTDDYILISETNYKAGQFGYRFLPYTYDHLLGFYDPGMVE